MKKLIFILFIIFIYSSVFAAEDLSGYSGTVYFAWDGEAQSFTADDGTGELYYAGGYVDKIAGGGCDSVATYYNSIISTETAARSAVTGSSYSLKTPYNAECSGESFQQDVTIIALASDVPEVYIRWYQKFTNTWQSGTQHKFTKFTDKNHVGEDEYTTGYSTFQGPTSVLSQTFNMVNGQFGVDKVRMWAVDPEYSISFADEINNGFSNFPTCTGTDANFVFQTGTWYCLEMHIKNNSNSSTADAVYEFWIDGHLYMKQTGFKYYDGTYTIPGIGSFEMQHLQQNRAANDEPAYMDNIVIGSSYIGLFGGSTSPSTANITGSHIAGGHVH